MDFRHCTSVFNMSYRFVVSDYFRAAERSIQESVYYYVIKNFNNPTILICMVWSIIVEVLFNGLVGFLVQGFLTLRVWRLSSNNLFITGTIACMVIAEFGMCTKVTGVIITDLAPPPSSLTRLLPFTAKAIQFHTWEELKALKGLSITVNILAVLPDVFIAASLFYFLQRSRTGFKNTGVFTSICAIASLVSILAWGNTLIYVAFYFSLGKRKVVPLFDRSSLLNQRAVYSNSLLATLNARITIRGLGEDSDELSFSLQTVTKSCQPTFNTSAILRPTNISIKIDTTQEPSRDHNIPDLEDDAFPALTEQTAIFFFFFDHLLGRTASSAYQMVRRQGSTIYIPLGKLSRTV
ncbi:hypothetical protein D9756_000609 [Leucocoprinus leucothites]|uniref:DUF6534 domain-containing protein n=1 Tax=Leucocoprinus leucothites TaxID=201217 RepID=A0A8H5LNJ2_9AGAR|nr:hypothetical protein D9756_000609 [Leucoagaricus leucothites]